MRTLFGLTFGLVVLGLTLPGPASAQFNIVPSCQFAARNDCGVMAGTNTLYRLTNALNPNDCSAGGGANEMLCFCEGDTCVVAVDDSGAGAITGTTSDFLIENATPSLDYTDTDTDDDDINASVHVNCTATGTGAEECDVTINQQKAGATQTAFSSDADGAISVGNLTDPPTQLSLYGINAIQYFQAGTPTIGITDTDTDDNDANVLMTAACTATGTGAEECDLNLLQQKGGANQSVFFADADGAIVVGNTTDPPTQIQLHQDTLISSTGNSELLFTDLDTDDDDVNAQINVNCTDTGTGAEDCDVSFIQQSAGGDVTFLTSDADGGATYDAAGTGPIVIGSGDISNVSIDSDVGLTFVNNSDSINNLADATFDLTRSDAGIVTVTCSDTDATAGCTYDAGGASPIVIGSADVTNVTVNSDVGLTFAGNSESVNNLADGIFDLTRDDAGVVSIVCSDDDGTAGCTYDAGGAAPIIVGSADVTVVTISTDDTGDGTDFEVPVDSIEADEILDTVCMQMMYAVYNPTEAGATDDFVDLFDNTFSATETAQDFVIPVGFVASQLRVEVDVAPGAGNDDWKVTLRDDVASTTLTCNIDETATSCTDAANTPSLAATSLISVLVDSSGGASDPDAAAELRISFCLSPD